MREAGHVEQRPPDPDEPGGAAPRELPPMPAPPPPARPLTPRQARLVARAGLVLTLLLAVAGMAGVVWATLAVAGIAR
ncbi:MAG TPA: hypothetical protein VFO60_05820 [Candidatus Dormibacteraeota bacterium]|nr:hypothetical protein [Candidatus Dormibacteraeota bacterium]